MSDENVNSIPEFDFISILQQRLAQKASSQPTGQSSTGKATIDPYQMMLKRRDSNAQEATSPVQTWPEEDIKKLEDFCRKMGIVGFNCGNMSPLSALAFLKQKLGVMDDTPKSEGYGPNYPYTEAMRKKQLLHG